MCISIQTSDAWERVCMAILRGERERYETRPAPAGKYGATASAMILAIVSRDPATLVRFGPGNTRTTIYFTDFPANAEPGGVAKTRFRSAARALCVAGDAIAAAVSVQILAHEEGDNCRRPRVLVYLEHQLFGASVVSAPYLPNGKLGKWEQHDLAQFAGQECDLFFSMLPPVDSGEGVFPLIERFAHLYVRQYFQRELEVCATCDGDLGDTSPACPICRARCADVRFVT